MTSAKRESQGR